MYYIYRILFLYPDVIIYVLFDNYLRNVGMPHFV